MSRRLLVAAATATLLAVLPASAGAMVRLPLTLPPVAGNPADALLAVPVDAPRYDPATHCTPRPRQGMTLFAHWLQRHARGVSWGTYRCERWGAHSASLHAEDRALDWHLDVTNAADRAEARRLIALFLAPDGAGNPQALARRMGVEEMIWDCGYWSTGMTQFQPYAPCYDRKGRRLAHVDPTQGHRNHIHFGLTRAGAAARTSFWTHGG